MTQHSTVLDFEIQFFSWKQSNLKEFKLVTFFLLLLPLNCLLSVFHFIRWPLNIIVQQIFLETSYCPAWVKWLLWSSPHSCPFLHCPVHLFVYLCGCRINFNKDSLSYQVPTPSCSIWGIFPRCVMCFISVSNSTPSSPQHWAWDSNCV